MIASVVQRLKDNTGGALKLVAKAGAYAEIADKPPQRHQMPAAYVIPLVERAGDADRATMVVVQKKQITFGVVLVLSPLKDPRGGAPIDDMETPRTAVNDALIGWTPDGMEQHCLFAEGRLQFVGNGLLLWMDSFRTREAIRKPIQA
jgi:hypothetical protein